MKKGLKSMDTNAWIKEVTTENSGGGTMVDFEIQWVEREVLSA